MQHMHPPYRGHWRRARLVVERTIVALFGLLFANANLVPLLARWLAG